MLAYGCKAEGQLATEARSRYSSGVTTTVQAIYENGKLLLPDALPLPEKARVRVTIEADDSVLTDAERLAWLKLSEQSLIKTWDNPGDDIFNELLQK